ncbi:MAG: LysR family transcriptional regulator [Candidimonas sp.]
MQDINDMVYFAEVVEAGGFSAAARALGLPKSRLSRRLARLEAELGMRLLQRTTRKLSLTAAGEQFYRHCVAVRDQVEQAQADLASEQREPRGIIKVVCPVTLAQTVIGPLLPAYLAAHPQVQLHMQVSNRVVDLVEEGVDVALRVRPSLDESGSLIVKRLGTSSGLLVASPRLFTDRKRPQLPSDLADMDSVSMSAADGRGKWLLHGPDGASATVIHHPRFVADDLLTLKFAVVQKMGVGFLPDYLCEEELRDGRLEIVLPAWRMRPGIVHAVYASRRGLSPAVRTFLDFLGERMGAV